MIAIASSTVLYCLLAITNPFNANEKNKKLKMTTLGTTRYTLLSLGFPAKHLPLAGLFPAITML